MNFIEVNHLNRDYKFVSDISVKRVEELLRTDTAKNLLKEVLENADLEWRDFQDLVKIRYRFDGKIIMRVYSEVDGQEIVKETVI